MGQWQFHTPDGVADLLPQECAAKRQLETRLRRLFAERGYLEIETPAIEFYDVYATGSGPVPQEGLFKFFDQQGRILCLRYDGTVPTARLAATLYRETPPPLRFCYLGSMYRYNEYGGGRQREFGQAGIELLGSNTPEADAEVIATAIAAAKCCGIEDLQVTIGQVAFYRGLLAEWNISGDEAALLPHLIDSKQQVALEELSDRLALPDKARHVLALITDGFGQADRLDELADLVSHPIALDALRNLRAVLDILTDYQMRPYVSADLGLLQSLNYYSGMIFKGFTYGLGFPLFSGGRYDQLVGAFGRNLAATGFSIGTSLALTALQRQGKPAGQIPQPILLGFARGQRAAALVLAECWRREGKSVITAGAGPEWTEQTAAAAGPVALLDDTGRLSWLKER